MNINQILNEHIKLILNGNIFNIFTKSLGLILAIILITLYWYMFNWILIRKRKSSRYFNKKYYFLRFVYAIIAIILTILTIILVFAENIGLLISGFSLLSAALVFALQDYVSCFFSWVYIELAKTFRVKDIIQITSDTREINGDVTEIGFFKTSIREKLGGTNFDKEMYTGKIVTFPNNFIFKHSLTNFSKNHQILFHNFKITIPFEFDFQHVNSVIEKAITQTSTKLMTKKDKYYGETMKDLIPVKPTLYHTIADNGVEFTIWYGCKIGMLRLVLEKYTANILDNLNKEQISMSYSTVRIVK